MRTRKVDTRYELHGNQIADPYQWLEDSESAEVRAWTDAQNADTTARLEAVPGRDALVARIRDLLRIGTVSGPCVIKPEGGGETSYFYVRREGDQNQPILYVRTGVRGPERVLLDPATMSADGTTALDWWFPSLDGELVAWGRSERGSEESTLFVRDVRTGTDLADTIPNTRHASVAWLPDHKGFYYSRYPEAGTVPPGDELYCCKIYFHALGTDWKDDPLVFERAEKTDVPQVMVSPNGRWLVVCVHIGWQRNEVFLRDRSQGDSAPWIEVATESPALYEAEPLDERMYIRTNDGAPRFRLFAVDYAQPARAAWQEILPEGPDALCSATLIGDTIVATYIQDASTRIVRFTTSGRLLGPITLPDIGVAAVSGAWNGDEVFVSFSSYVRPPEVTRVDLKSIDTSSDEQSAPRAELWDRVGASFSASGVQVKIHYATSKDGTKIPMFVVAREGISLDGKNPTIVWGYGGFSINQTPTFSVRALLTVERGGVWVGTILRGGGELGEAWHQAGMLEKKQNVFDDFIACAETLIAEKITSPEHLAIIGGSNGGLLVAAAITQRPDLYRAAAALVPLTDMLRFHRFRIGRFWTSEYGDPDDPKRFPPLFAYSPYHQVKEGTRYPATLLTTAENDSRVDPMHALKMAARLQEAQADVARPILLRVESKAGHGVGKPITKHSVALADELSFLFHEIGLDPS